MKSIIMVKNLKDQESAMRIDNAMQETRVDYRIDTERQCVIIEGNSDMVSVARKIISDLGFMLL